MSYITTQELRDASVDAGTLEKFTLGKIGERNINREGNDVQNLATIVDRVMSHGSADVYATRAEMEADTTKPRGTWAVVINDPNQNNNGYYRQGVDRWGKTALQPATQAELKSFDALTVNRGKTFPLKAMKRDGIVSDSSGPWLDAFLNVRVVSARPGKLYRIAYLQNGALLGGNTLNNWVVEEFEEANYETNSALGSGRIISYEDPGQPQYDREGGIQTVTLRPKEGDRSLSQIRVIITLDVQALPPSGRALNALSSSDHNGWSWVIDPACYEPFIDKRVGALLSNQGAVYPNKPKIRGGVQSSANNFLMECILDVTVVGARPGRVYGIRYFKNGTDLLSGPPDGWIIESQDEETYEQDGSQAIRVINYVHEGTPEIPRNGIQTVRLVSPREAGLEFVITLDTGELPAYGTPIKMLEGEAAGRSWIIDPSCYVYQQSVQTPVQSNPLIYTIDANNMMALVWRSGSFLYRLRFGPNGANNLPNVRGIEYAPLASVQEAEWTLVNAASTDWLPPMVLRAVNNGDSHRAVYTGGNHGADGTSGGGSTARCVLFQWYLDGEPFEMGRAHSGDVQRVTAVIVNELMAFNTTGTVDPVAFPARYVLRQTFVVDFVPGSIEVLAHIEALEDVEILTDNGPQMVSVGFQGEQVFVGSGIGRGAFDATQNSGPSSDAPDCWALVLSSGAGQQVSWVDRSYEAGDGRYVSPTAAFIRGGGAGNTKMYHAIVASKTVPLAAGNGYRWRGGYAWQAPGLAIDAGLDCRIDYLREGRPHHAFVKPSTVFFVIP